MTERVAIASLGAVGRVIARQVSEKLPEYRLSAVTARRLDRARDFVRSHGLAADVVGLERISENADIVIECAPAQVYRDRRARDRVGKIDHAGVGAPRPLGPRGRGRATVAGSSCSERSSLDAVQGVSEGVVHSVRMVTPNRWRASVERRFERQGIDLDHVTEPTLLFAVRPEAVSASCQLNVSVALSLAGSDRQDIHRGMGRSTVEHNTHRIQVDSDSASISRSRTFRRRTRPPEG